MEKENEGYKLLLGAILLVPEALPDLVGKDGETGGGRKKKEKGKIEFDLCYAQHVP